MLALTRLIAWLHMRRHCITLRATDYGCVQPQSLQPCACRCHEYAFGVWPTPHEWFWHLESGVEG